jgi:hypothetical protein
MTNWNYRVIRKQCPASGDITYHVHEVYYREDGHIDCWTQEPVQPLGITEAQLRNDIYAFLSAFRLPVLEQCYHHGELCLVEQRLPRGDRDSLQADYHGRATRAAGYLFQMLGNHLLLKQDPELRRAYDRLEQAITELCTLSDRAPAVKLIAEG